MKLTKRAVEGIVPSGKRENYFDEVLTGFCLRVGVSGEKSFYVVYRTGKGRSFPKRWLKLGTFPETSVEQARAMAKAMLAKVAQGEDPSEEIREEKGALSVKDVFLLFEQEHIDTRLKPKTVHEYKRIIERLILPELGREKINRITPRHCSKLHHSLRETPYQANRCLAVLSKFFAWCEKNGYRDKGTNPAEYIEKFKEHKRQEFLTEEELKILGETLARMEQTWHERQKSREKRTSALVDTITPQAAAVIRLLMFTGARVGEILSLEWGHIDTQRALAILPDSKTGFKVLQLPAPALEVLDSLPKMSKWVFPSDSASGHMVNIKDAWGDVLLQAGLSGWRLHDLRHAFASVMVNSGSSLPIVGKILGHRNTSTTQRYAHLEENPAKKAAEEAAARRARTIGKA